MGLLKCNPMSTSPILLDLPEVLTGDRIVLRVWRPGDGKALYDAIQESLDHILPWMPWGPQHDRPEVSEKLIREWIAQFMLREHISMGIWNPDGSRLLGSAGIPRLDWDMRSFELGYWIRATEHRKGYVTDAVKLLTEFAFDTLQANRVFIRCSTKNLRSGAIPRRLGFVHEGVARNSIKDAIGEMHDVDVYSLIPDEFAHTRKAWSQ
jgi:RimJ/RimL family protein N-acetyltransferase